MLRFRGRQWIAVGLTTLGVGLGCHASLPPGDLVVSTSDVDTSAAEPRATTVMQGDIPFIVTYAAGKEESERTGKPMMLFFTADWCNYCGELVEESFRHPQVAAAAERFVCTLIDADKEKEVCRQFNAASFPTIQFLSPSGVPLNRMTGKKPARQVALEMQTALQAVARRLNTPTDTIQR